jgi:hypothetical protein
MGRARCAGVFFETGTGPHATATSSPSSEYCRAMPTAMMVEIGSGNLRGRRTDLAYSFLGILYAANTSGRNRFLAPRPRPVPRWTGVRDALAYGDRCPQTVESIEKLPVLAWYGQASAFSASCGVLNVFTPDLLTPARRPVHGGGYASGGGGLGLDGSRLAAHGDIVVVTVNHRLNLFGYTNLGYPDGAEFADGAKAGQLDLVAVGEEEHLCSRQRPLERDTGRPVGRRQQGDGGQLQVAGWASARG